MTSPIGDNVRIEAIASPSTPDRLTLLQPVSSLGRTDFAVVLSAVAE